LIVTGSSVEVFLTVNVKGHVLAGLQDGGRRRGLGDADRRLTSVKLTVASSVAVASVPSSSTATAVNVFDVGRAAEVALDQLVNENSQARGPPQDGARDRREDGAGVAVGVARQGAVDAVRERRDRDRLLGRGVLDREREGHVLAVSRTEVGDAVLVTLIVGLTSVEADRGVVGRGRLVPSSSTATR